MRFWEIEPEVPGHISGDSIICRASHPPKVTSLHFVFDGWLGDELVASFPCFLVSRRLAEIMNNESLSGYKVEFCKVSTSVEYEEMRVVEPMLPPLPNFLWLQVSGRSGDSDICLNDRNRLMVSNRAMDVIRPFINNSDYIMVDYAAGRPQI